MSYTKSLGHTWDSESEITLIARQLDFDIGFTEERQLVHTTARPRIQDIASPHESSTTLLLDCWWRGLICFCTEDIRRELDIELQCMCHSYS